MTTDSAADSDAVMLCLRVPAALKERLAKLSSEAGVTIQSIGRRAIEAELDARDALLADAAQREPEIRDRVRSALAHRDS